MNSLPFNFVSLPCPISRHYCPFWILINWMSKVQSLHQYGTHFKWFYPCWWNYVNIGNVQNFTEWGVQERFECVKIIVYYYYWTTLQPILCIWLMFHHSFSPIDCLPRGSQTFWTNCKMNYSSIHIMVSSQ